jgi:glycosyltransferase involved in cell wall biosynthesis
MVALLPTLKRITNHRLRVVLCQRVIRKHIVVEHDGVEYEGIPDFFPTRFNRKALHFPTSIKTSPALRRFLPDLVHAFGFETGNALVGLRSGFPVSCFIQGIAEYLEPYCGHLGSIDGRILVWAERVAVPRVRWMVAENHFAKNWALSRNPEAVVDIIPHPTREIFFERASPRFEREIVTVGGLDSRKGMDTVIRAFAMVTVHGARLVVVGGGPLQHELEQLARTLGIADRVEFTGPLETDNVITKLNRARAFVIASRMDTSPNVVSEAHAIGLPVIGTRVGGIPEMIDDGDDGFLFERDDVPTLAERMQRLLENESLARRLGATGRNKVRSMNSATDVAEAHARYFEKIGRTLGVIDR